MINIKSIIIYLLLWNSVNSQLIIPETNSLICNGSLIVFTGSPYLEDCECNYGFGAFWNYAQSNEESWFLSNYIEWHHGFNLISAPNPTCSENGFCYDISGHETGGLTCKGSDLWFVSNIRNVPCNVVDDQTVAIHPCTNSITISCDGSGGVTQNGYALLVVTSVLIAAKILFAYSDHEHISPLDVIENLICIKRGEFRLADNSTSMSIQKIAEQVYLNGNLVDNSSIPFIGSGSGDSFKYSSFNWTCYGNSTHFFNCSKWGGVKILSNNSMLINTTVIQNITSINMTIIINSNNSHIISGDISNKLNYIILLTLNISIILIFNL
jgi:general stress protein CsbA